MKAKVKTSTKKYSELKIKIYTVFNYHGFISLFLEYELYVRSNQGLNYDTLRSYTLDITCIDQRRNDSSVFYIYLLRNKPPRFLNLQGILNINKPPILEIRRKIKRLCNMIWILISIHDYFNVNAFHWQAIIFHLIGYTDIYIHLHLTTQYSRFLI